MAETPQTRATEPVTEQGLNQEASAPSKKLEFGVKFPGQPMIYLDLDSGEGVSLSGGEDILIFGANQAATDMKAEGEHLDILFEDGRSIRLLSYESANETCPVTIDLVETGRAQFLAQQTPEELFIGQDRLNILPLDQYSPQKLPELALIEDALEQRQRGGDPFIRPEAEPFLEREDEEEILEPPGIFDAPQFAQIIGANSYDFSGRSLGMGDFNGDGFDEVLIGAFQADNSEVGSLGRAFAVFGNAEGIDNPFQLSSLETANGGDGSNGFLVRSSDVDIAGEIGRDVSTAKDFNGDGFEDLILGIPNLGVNDTGGGVIIFGTPNFNAEVDLADIASGDGSAGTLLVGINNGDLSGIAVSGGDFNGDGFSDVALGQPFAVQDGFLIFNGQPNPPAILDGADLLIANGNDGTRGTIAFGLGEETGNSLDFGDFNGDGFDDIIAGAPQGFPAAGAAAGKAFLLLGSVGGLPAGYDLSFFLGPFGSVLNGAQAGENAGYDVAFGGDFNGDGFDDLLIGAPFADVAGEVNVGRVFIVFGLEGGLPSEFNLGTLIGGDGSEGIVINGMQPGGLFGYAVTGLGDLNGDGFDDISIGAPFANGGVGSALTIFGGPANTFEPVNELNTFDAGNSFTQDGLFPDDNFGQAVTGMGDTVGTGFTSDITGASGNDDGGTNAGRTSLITGFNTGKVDIQGTPDPDDLMGTPDADNIVAAQDDDIIRGEGGADNLMGGQGDDLFITPDFDFLRVFGGSGTDTLEITGTGLTGDFTIPGGLIKRVKAENIDLGNTNNTIILSAISVINLTRDDINTNAESIAGLDGVNTLMVFGSATDTVELTDEWVIVDTVIFEGESFTRLIPDSNTLATILVQDDIILELPDVGPPVFAVALAPPPETDDVFPITEQNFIPVDGAGGEDTLVLEGDGLILDFTQLAQDIAQNIERIDLNASGSQTLILELQDIIDMTDENNVLDILGTSEDSVELQLIGEGFTQTTEGAFDVYTNGSVTLRVESAIDQSEILLDAFFV